MELDESDEEEEPVVESKEVYAQRKLRNRVEEIAEARTIASTGQNKQADKMLKKNKKAINGLKVGDLVLVTVEGVDRGAADAKNILGYVIEKRHDGFKVGCKVGIMDPVFQWNQLNKTELVSDWKIEDIPKKELSIRSAVVALSVGHGQGVLKCGCKKACGGKCSCLKAKQICNSRCHGGNKNKHCTNC